jgi:hypothetical protein
MLFVHVHTRMLLKVSAHVRTGTHMHGGYYIKVDLLFSHHEKFQCILEMHRGLIIAGFSVVLIVILLTDTRFNILLALR